MTWSDYWGGGSDAVGALWVRMNRDVPIIGALGEILESRHLRFVGVLRSIQGAFFIETARGAALELWGELLGVMRLGLEDEPYRRLIQVQQLLVLSGASTRAKMIAVFETWTQVAATEVRSVGRMFEIGGPVPASAEDRLVSLLERVIPAGRQVRAYAVTSDDLVADYALDPTGETTVVDYALDPITGAAPTAERIL